MANANDNLKFLNLTQLGTLVNKIKGLISDAQTASTITAINFGKTNSKNTLTITQGKTPIVSNEIPTVSDTTDGFMSADQYKTINTNITNLQSTTGSAVQMVGTSNGTKTSLYTPLTSVKVGDTTYNNVALIQLVDSFDNLTEDKKTQAPTVNVVKNYTDAVNTALTDYISANDIAVGKKLDTSVFNTFKSATYDVFVNNTNIELGKKANATDVYTKTELTGADGKGGLLGNKVDTTTFTAHTSAFDTFKKAVAGDNGDGTGGYLANKADKSTTYTKTEVDNEIAKAKKEIIGGDEQHKISETYDTLIEIADWIENDKNGAAALAKQVATNTDNITTLTGLVGATDKDGLRGQVATNTSAITNLQNGKANNATTLAGYGIKDAYTKTETDSAIDTKVNPVKTLAESLRDTELPKKADKTDVFTSLTDFVLSGDNTTLTATFTKGDNKTTATLNISLITESDINALFA